MSLRTIANKLGLPRKYERAFYKAELKGSGLMPWRDRIRWVRRGFLSDSVELYGLDGADLNEYLTDKQRFMSAHLNGKNASVLDDKLCFEAVIGKFITVPKTIGTVFYGRFTSLDPKIPDDITHILHVLEEKQALVMKTITTDGGKGVHILRYSNNGIRIDRETMEPAQALESIKKMHGSMVSEFAQQSVFASGLYPHSTNTIRIVTMVDPESGEVFIPFATFRIGTAASAPLDNVSVGGLSAGIDISTGQLRAAVCPSRPGARITYDDHPDTGAKIRGLEIPDWESICAQVIAVAQRVPFLSIVGWDILLVDSGICAIEGNSWPGMRLIQSHEPVLRSERVRGFYRYHGIL